MEALGDGWQDELEKYFRFAERLTVKSLKRIKRDRVRNNLPFDEAFKKYFLDRTNLRIANAYTDFLFEERFADEVNQQSDGIAGASIQHQSTSTIVSPESIHQMPTGLVPSNNQSLASNTTACTAQGNNQLSQEVICPLSASQIQSVPLEAASGRNGDREWSAQPKKERGITNESSIDSDPNEGNNELETVANGMAMESVSTGADRSNYEKPFKQMVNSNTHQQSETIDLTSDQEDVADELSSDHIIEGEAAPNVQQQKTCEAPAAGSSEQMGRYDNLSHGDEHLRSKYRITQPAEPNILTSQTDRNSEQQSTGTNDVSNHLTADVKIEDESTTSNDNLDQSSVNKATEIPLVEDQIGPVLSSGTNRDANSEEILSDESKDLDREQRPDHGNVSMTAEEIAGPSQSTIHRRKRGNGSAMVSDHLKKKPKRTNAVDTKKRHKCELCGYSTDVKGSFARHIRTHTDERPYECAVCNRSFTQKGSLNGHMKTHRHLFQFQCSNCRQGFSDEMKWRSHQSHCKAKGYECHLCKKIFLDKRLLVDHMRAHTGARLRCSNCQKQFSFNQNLICHMKSHGNLFRYQCSNCRQGFSKKTPWKLHESRCKSKQYECYLCGRKFHHLKTNLLNHMRHKHTGEKPFGCSDCPKRFCRKPQLIRHAKRCHLNVD